MSTEKKPDPLPPATVPLPVALDKTIAMPPALVEAIEKDPDLLVALTRGQLAIVQDRLVRKALTDPEISLGQLAMVHEALTKNAALKNPQPSPIAGGAGGAKVVINIMRAPGREAVTIESGEHKVVADAN